MRFQVFEEFNLNPVDPETVITGRRHSPGMSESKFRGVTHAGILLHHVADEIFSYRGEDDDTRQRWA